MRLTVIIYIFFITACNTSNEPAGKASEVISKCIEAHGGSNYDKFDVSFVFRQYTVRLKNDHGKFLYERTYQDSINNTCQEKLTNDSFIVKRNGKVYQPDALTEDRLKEALNSIAYFTLLPYKLADPAVIATHSGTVSLDGKSYHKIAVSFMQENGGKDHRDEFCFWIDTEQFQLNFLAYSNGGPRFRKVKKRYKCGGIILQDYYNFAMSDTSMLTTQYDAAYQKGQFNLLSTIEQTQCTAGDYPKK